MKYGVTELPAGAVLVRLLVDDGPDYDRMIVVIDDDTELFLMGWVGKPLTVSEWREAQRELFPNARRVRFMRWSERAQTYREVTIEL